LKEKCQKEWPSLPHSFSAQSKCQVMDAEKKIKSCDIGSVCERKFVRKPPCLSETCGFLQDLTLPLFNVAIIVLSSLLPLAKCVSVEKRQLQHPFFSFFSSPFPFFFSLIFVQYLKKKTLLCPSTVPCIFSIISSEGLAWLNSL